MPTVPIATHSSILAWAESRPASPKRPRRSQSSEAAEPLEALTSKLSNQMGALEVVLDELRAPGGAFLPVATDHMEPTASQRAWLTWQLTHAGTALHWALTALDSLLAAHETAYNVSPILEKCPRLGSTHLC